MELAGWISGVLLIVFGILGWKFPQLINIFSKEDKEKMDLAGVGKLFRNIFVIVGIINIAIAYFFPKVGIIAFVIFTLTAVFLFAFKAEKYKDKK